MSPERTFAYQRVIKTLDELGPSKLLGAEQDRIRHAADNLVFCSNIAGDIAAQEALEDIERLCHALTESGRWERVTAERLSADVHACGPRLSLGLLAA